MIGLIAGEEESEGDEDESEDSDEQEDEEDNEPEMVSFENRFPSFERYSKIGEWTRFRKG